MDYSGYLERIAQLLEELVQQNTEIIKQNQQLLNVFLKYDKSYNEEIIKDQGRTDLM